MRRGFVLGVPGLALAVGAGVWAEVRRVVNAPFPHFEDGDPSGLYGDPNGAPVRVDVLGDSCVTGPGLAAGSHSWIAQLVDRLPWQVHLTSHAVGGSRVRDVLLRQVPRALLDPPDLYVVAVGSNDVLHATPSRQFRRDLEVVLEVLRAAAPVVTLGVGDLSVIPRMHGSLRPLVSRRCGTIDRLHATVTSGREGVVRIPVPELTGPHFRGAGPELFVEDLFHPNAIGHALWADLFGPYVHSALEATLSVLDLRQTVHPVGDPAVPVISS